MLQPVPAESLALRATVTAIEMASWLASLVLASIVAVGSATSYGGYHQDSRPHGGCLASR